jgi:methionine-rich copper-binding protein CopC
MVREIGAVALVVMLSGFPGAAKAHTHLKKSVPAAGANVATGPSEIRLQFDETVEPRFSKISVEAKGGKAVTSEPATSDPNDKMTLIVKFAQPLQAGSYMVNWQVVSADTHKVKGSFTFQVRP